MAMFAANSTKVLSGLVVLLLLLPLAVAAGDEGDSCHAAAGPDDTCRNKDEGLKLRVGAIFLILCAGAIGVCVPIVGKSYPKLSAESDAFFVIKAFAAGVILATGFIHVLPDAFDSLGSPCLSENPWAKFPFAGFIAMMTVMGTLMLETSVMSYYKRQENSRSAGAVGVEELEGNETINGAMHVHTHATHSHAHGPASEITRHRIISQVLELGIVVHSVIIGVALGASNSPCTIKPLMTALSFHQFFEGMGLGGCIVQARFRFSSMALMVVFFSITTPVGIALGIGISTRYNKSSSTTLIVEGCFNAASAGILIYMALVDLLAADFASLKMQSNVKLQIITNAFLLMGAGMMSIIAKWN